MGVNPRQSGRLLALGLDGLLTERLKKVINEHHLRIRLSSVARVESELPESVSDIDILMVQVPAHFGQSLKLVQDLLYRFPHAALLVISPKSDSHLLVHFFRAGVFDVLMSPFDELEMAQVLRRAGHRPADMKNPGDWTPLQAAAHFFTRPLADALDDMGDNLQRYFSLFLDIKEHHRFASSDAFLDTLANEDLEGVRERKIRQFLADPKGIFFGLNLQGHSLSWVVKLASDCILVWQGEITRRARKEEVFGQSFLNLLRGQKGHFESQLERERMQRLALTDEITGLWNQRRLQKDLEERVATGQAFGLMFIDIDFFKNVNDQYGHVHGSQLLIDMADILRKELRGSDSIYRYGGDEFIVLLPAASLDEAKKIALRVSASVKDHNFQVNQELYKLSLSVGLADYPRDAGTVKDLIDFADKMMYMSKKSGRGKVFHVTEVL